MDVEYYVEKEYCVVVLCFSGKYGTIIPLYCYNRPES